MVAPLFVVNPASGGGFGIRLLRHLEGLLPGRSHQLGVESLRAVGDQARREGAAVVACGGDGTVAAVLDAVQPQRQAVGGSEAAAEDDPVVAIVPLGTGNDLGRGFGYPGSAASIAAVDRILAALPRARPTPLDRWRIDGPCGARTWFNYCSWGFDARIAWQFDRLRRRHARTFRNRWTNMACYASIGLQERGIDLGVQLVGSAAERRAPAWTRSLIIANIPTYAGGRRLGREVRSDDGRCDVFALAAGVAFGLGLTGWRRPLRLGRFSELDVRLDRPGFMQLDGEPVAARPGIYRIARAGRVRLLALPDDV